MIIDSLLTRFLLRRECLGPEEGRLARWAAPGPSAATGVAPDPA